MGFSLSKLVFMGSGVCALRAEAFGCIEVTQEARDADAQIGRVSGNRGLPVPVVREAFHMPLFLWAFSVVCGCAAFVKGTQCLGWRSCWMSVDLPLVMSS